LLHHPAPRPCDQLTQQHGVYFFSAGDYSSPNRFTRMAMIRAATLATCWPTVAANETQLLSPGSLPNSQYPQHAPALLAVLGITQSVYLPRGEIQNADKNTLLSDNGSLWGRVEQALTSCMVFRQCCSDSVLPVCGLLQQQNICVVFQAAAKCIYCGRIHRL
jgi:hypothetical protein